MHPQLVLVVEDDPDIREILVDEFAAAGFRVAPAEHGEAALRVIAVAPPSVVVTDLMMPRMDGATFIARFREIPEYASVPVIVVTASAVTRVPGANVVFRKPFELSELMRTVAVLAPSPEGPTQHA